MTRTSTASSAPSTSRKSTAASRASASTAIDGGEQGREEAHRLDGDPVVAGRGEQSAHVVAGSTAAEEEHVEEGEARGHRLDAGHRLDVAGHLHRQRLDGGELHRGELHRLDVAGSTASRSPTASTASTAPTSRATAAPSGEQGVHVAHVEEGEQGGGEPTASSTSRASASIAIRSGRQQVSCTSRRTAPPRRTLASLARRRWDPRAPRGAPLRDP